jgi:hypothetical protein
MQSLILVETMANGSKRSHPLSLSAKITVQAGASYTVIDTATGRAPAGLQLQREDDALKVVVDQETVARLQDFYREDITAELTTDGTVAVSADVLISGTSAEMTGASSGDVGGSSFLTVAGSIGLGAVIGGGAYTSFMDAKNDGGSSTTISGRQTSFIDTSIVVFDLVNGESSSHSTKTFDADTAYTIYIVIDSAGQEPSLVPTWSGGENLGSDDKIILVGNGEPIVGNKNNAIASVRFSSYFAGTVSWATGENELDFAAYLFQNGVIFNQSQNPVDLWTGTVPGAMNLLRSFSWINSLPNGIRSSQGLA